MRKNPWKCLFVGQKDVYKRQPAQWVTVNPLRTVDSYTHVWWFSKTDYPKADNRKVLRPYSESMKSLLKRGSYNAGKRPSEHSIGEKSFLNDRGGARCV